MASILYREGKGTIEHGIECESTIVEPHHVDGLIAAGWSANPPGYVPPEPVVVDDIDDEDGEGDPKSVLAEDLESLTKQVELLTQIDANRESQIEGLNQELQSVTIERDNLKAEVAKLEEELALTKNDGADDSSLNPVRVAAKEKGIEGWDTKRLATLQAALDALEGKGEA